MRKISKYWGFVIVFAAVIIVLNLLAISKGFCDWYTDNVFWISSAVYSRITGLFAFSVGEVLLGIAALLIIAMVVIAVVLIFMRKRARFVRFCKRFYKTMLVIGLVVAFVMTVNCSIPYNCSVLEVNGNGSKTYSTQDLIRLRKYIVENCNELALQVPRDEKGYVKIPEDINEKIKEGYHRISNEYPRMSGYFPNAKAMMGSDFMYQAGMLGIYFPFTMEANYNKYVSTVYTAQTIAHELAHLKGYMYEDEANYMAYLACVASDDITVRYSGFLSVFEYVNFDVLKIYADSGASKTIKYADFCDGAMLSDLADSDDHSYDIDTIEELNNKDFIIKTEVVENISDSFTNSYLEYYGATANYDEVTKLLLQYYDGNLGN